MPIVRKSMELIHFGSNRYDPRRFRNLKVSDNIVGKPHGGLWACPINAKKNWESFSRKAYHNPYWLNRSFKIICSGTYLVIDKYEDLKYLRWLVNDKNYSFDEVPEISDIDYYQVIPDIMEIAKTVDAIYLTSKGESQTRYFDNNGYPRKPCLEGWDCECVFIMNKKTITPIGEIK